MVIMVDVSVKLPKSVSNFLISGFCMIGRVPVPVSQSGIQGFRDSGIQGFRDSGIQGFSRPVPLEAEVHSPLRLHPPPPVNSIRFQTVPTFQPSNFPNRSNFPTFQLSKSPVPPSGTTPATNLSICTIGTLLMYCVFIEGTGKMERVVELDLT
jgi:hypothetical protein